MSDPAEIRAQWPRLSRRRLLRDSAIATGGILGNEWFSPRAFAQETATPIAVPGSGGEIGRPETVPIDHVIVIFSKIDHSIISMEGFRAPTVCRRPGLSFPKPIVTACPTRRCRPL